MTMALTDERLAELLAYCKLTELSDDPEVELLIPSYYEAAVDYMEDAGIRQPVNTGRLAKYNLCVNAMVLDLWEHRDTKEPTAVAENPVFRRYINQLKQTEPVSYSDTGTVEAII
jgi:hypothetical protein